MSQKRGRLAIVSVIAGVVVLGAAAAALTLALVGNSAVAAARSVAVTTSEEVVANDFVGFCSHAVPAQRSACLNETTGSTVKASNFHVGEVVVQGNEALFVNTGTLCISGTCRTNTDPKAGLDNGKNFSQVYALEISTTQSGPPWVSALTDQGGTWYLTGFSGSSGTSKTNSSSAALNAWLATIRPTFVDLETKLHASTTDPTTAAVLADCSGMAADARALQAMPAAPVAAVNTPWQTGLTDAAAAGDGCVSALSSGNQVQLGQANASASAAQAAFQQFSTAVSQADGG